MLSLSLSRSSPHLLSPSLSLTRKNNVDEVFSVNTRRIGVMGRAKRKANPPVILPRFEVSDGFAFVLLNPKTHDPQANMFSKAVLELYSTELPAMSFAANTGKRSLFLEKCVTSGKYITLLLVHEIKTMNEDCSSSACERNWSTFSNIHTKKRNRLSVKQLERLVYCRENLRMMEKYKSNVGGLRQVVGAITYQILPVDTQFAEIPLAAISKSYQRKGLGTLLYKELQRRLQDIGILTVYCWGDEESELFWIKQGFMKAAEVDGRGKPLKLPIKSVVRKSMSIPGSATLMVRHMGGSMSCKLVCSANEVTPPRFLGVHGANLLGSTSCTIEEWGEPSPSLAMATKTPTLGMEMKPNTLVTPVSVTAILHGLDKTKLSGGSKGLKRGMGVQLVHSNQYRRRRTCASEETFAQDSLHVTPMEANNLAEDNSTPRGIAMQLDFDMVETRRREMTDATITSTSMPTTTTTTALGQSARVIIMFMNMSDDDRRLQLTKCVENLGGGVSCDGSNCTHVLTGEIRRTRNFCMALCAGAWVLSPNWLKASVKENRFVDEAPFVVKDEAFEMKYRVKLEDVIRRARLRPKSLFKGYSIYLTPHVHPPLETIKSIIEFSGGKVLSSLEANASDTIVVACEEDINEALVASKSGLLTYTSEWLMCAVMKQYVDLTVSKFAESL